MKFLVFGGTGFLGSNLVQYLINENQEVVAVSKAGKRNSLSVDITNEQEFSKIDFKPDFIVNCASQIPVFGKTSNDPEYLEKLFSTNVVGAANISNWAVKNDVPKIFNCSTLVVVKKPWPNMMKEDFFKLPDGPHVGYSMSKLSQEQIMNELVTGSSCHVLHLRLSAIYGENMVPQGILFYLMNKLKRGEDVILTDATKTSFDFINIHDVCRIILKLARNNLKINILNTASGIPVSLMEVTELLKEIMGSNSTILNTDTKKKPSPSNINIENLRNQIGTKYNFVDLKEGLKRIYMYNQESSE